MEKVKPKKHLGQHFLTDTKTAARIAQTLQPLPIEWAVLEVGPGMGALTQHLKNEYPNNSLLLSEVDQESIAYLEANLAFETNQFIGDFITTTLNQDVEYAVIGNFPYNISTQIVFKTLENRNNVPIMCGMFQKEVALRICALHGSKTYGILSVMTQAYYKCEYLFTVNEGAFNPPPKVKSGVIRLKRHEKTIPCSYKSLLLLVKTAFNQRRKMLSNALKPLNQLGWRIPMHLEHLRAEQLTVAQFVELASELDNYINK